MSNSYIILVRKDDYYKRYTVHYRYRKAQSHLRSSKNKYSYYTRYRKKNSRELAKLLKINRTKIHYHLNILEENNFIEVVDTDSINGIIQKYYLPTAQAFVPSPNIFNDLFNNTSVNFNVKKEDVKDFWDSYNFV